MADETVYDRARKRVTNFYAQVGKRLREEIPNDEEQERQRLEKQIKRMRRWQW